MRNIHTGLLEHLAAAENSLRENQRDVDILGVFLVGSQNYNFSDENSDVDTKCIVVPSMKELCLKNPISVEHVLPNNEHCNIKDIRLAVREFRKMNIDDVQLLYTDYFWVNSKYIDLWLDLKSKRDKIAYGDKQTAVKTIFYQIRSKLESSKSNPKVLANNIRLDYFIKQYINDKAYDDCIKLPDILYDNMTREKLLAIKRMSFCDIDEEYKTLLEEIYREYEDVACPVKETDEKDKIAMNEILDEFLINIMSKGIN